MTDRINSNISSVRIKKNNNQSYCKSSLKKKKKKRVTKSHDSIRSSYKYESIKKYVMASISQGCLHNEIFYFFILIKQQKVIFFNYNKTKKKHDTLMGLHS